MPDRRQRTTPAPAGISPPAGESGPEVPDALARLAQLAVARLAEGAIVADADGRIVFVNDAARALHGVASLGVGVEGYTAEYHLFTLDGEPHPPHDLPLARAVERGETVADARWRIRRPDGTEIVAEGSAAPLVDAAGRRHGAVLTIRDVSDEVAVRDALRRSEERFRAISTASAVGIFYADLEGNVSYANPRLQRTWDMRERELLGRGWTARVFADDLGPLLDAWRAANAAGAEFEHEFRLLLPGGRVRWVHGRSAVIRDAAGRPTRTVGTVEDVTERRVAVERTRRLLALTTALASTLTADEVAHAVAEHAAAALGATSCVVALVSADGTRLERVGTGALPAAIAPDYTHMPVDVAVPIAEAVRSGRPVVVADGAALRERYPDARAVWDELDVHAVLAAPIELDGRRLGVVGFRFSTAREILDDDLAFVRAACQQCAVSLERARLFAAERAARTDADTANRAKSEFLARMSHELRTPLNAIAGHVQLVEIGIHGPVTPAQHEALGRAARAQQHLLGLINDVLNFAKLEAGRIQFDVREVAAAEVVDGVRHMVEPQLAAKGLGFELRAPTDPAVLVWADHDKLTQVLLNLLSNAIKFTPAADGRGLVRLELLAPADDPAHATFRVSDTGIGIPADRLDAIFEPFVQVSPGRSAFTREHPGSGLGLAISRDLVTGMGGELTVESAIGAGSAFTVLLRRSVTATGERTERRARDDRRVGVDRRGPPRRSP